MNLMSGSERHGDTTAQETKRLYECKCVEESCSANQSEGDSDFLTYKMDLCQSAFGRNQRSDIIEAERS